MHDVVWMTALVFGLMFALSAHAHFQHPVNRERFVAHCRRGWAWCHETAIDLYCRIAGSVLELRDTLRKIGERETAVPIPMHRIQLFEYLVLLRSHPELAAPPRVRLAKAIRDGGVDWHRTLELRIRKDNKFLFAWKVFADLPGLDQEALHQLVITLEHGRDGIILLEGPPACGKSMLVDRLSKLLGALYLPVVDGMQMNFNPLRLLHYSETEAVAAQIMRRYNVNQKGVRAAAPLTRFERELVKVATKGNLVEAHVKFVRIGDNAVADCRYGVHPNPEQFTGRLDFARLGTCPDVDLIVLDGAAHVSNGGLLVADEVLKNDAETVSGIVDALAGYAKTPMGHHVGRHGLIIGTALPQDLERAMQNRALGRFLDEAQIIRLNPVTDKAESERFVAASWKKMLRGGRAAELQLDPAAVPYLAMVIRLSTPHMSPRALQQMLELLMQRTWQLRQRMREVPKEPTLIPMDEVQFVVANYIRTRLDGMFLKDAGLQQVTAAIQAANEWLALPHPIIEVQRKVAELATDFKKQMADAACG